jgi:hypothetical protein
MVRCELKTCQQVVNSTAVIHTPFEYTAEEAVAQGKKLQNDKCHNNQGSMGAMKGPNARWAVGV